MLCLLCLVLVSNSVQWVVVEHDQSAEATEKSSYFVLVLRGESLKADLFKSELSKMKKCHATMAHNGRVQAAKVEDEAVIRQIITAYNQYATAAAAALPQLWQPKAGSPIALTLFPIAAPSASDSFVKRLIDYHSTVSRKAAQDVV
jgi:hypothetical protein